MNEQLQKFIEWLPQNVEEFKDKSADEIAQILNQLSQTDEGKQQLSQLMEQFNSSVSQFRAGGKFASFVKKFSNGGGGFYLPKTELNMIETLRENKKLDCGRM